MYYFIWIGSILLDSFFVSLFYQEYLRRHIINPSPIPTLIFAIVLFVVTFALDWHFGNLWLKHEAKVEREKRKK
ncbi:MULTISPECIES: hypothetical protein [unclassified Roseburia]|uniref:hypothetical protein n=1 Tax=unclassified Roseburia TaxID=2637578 RepID=UPI000E471E7F|nr:MULTISPECIES: hypothetical protein [unclassified Roseburia]RGI48450.1 hypothetical protein DXB39_06960 [Roseburia sp. OM03-7AC]RGI51652.1 hypothetical protein DXB35_06725 [Roseburia sp. OM03-18]